MKHLTTILAAVLCAVCLSGCEGQTQKQNFNIQQKLRAEKTTHFGHSYVYFYDYSFAYDPITVQHDPDCPCHKNNPELLNEK